MITSRLVILVLTACLIPPLLQWYGVDFGTPAYKIETYGANAVDLTESLNEEALFLSQGVIVHSLTEWTAVCLAFLTAVLSAVHYFLKRDVTTPVIATALTFAALLDAFRVLAIDRLIVDIQDPVAFTKITWAVSRVFLITLLVSGTMPFVIRRDTAHRPTRDLRDFALLFIAYGLAAFVIIFYAGRWLHFSGNVETTNEFSWRINFAALLLFAVAGGIVLTIYGSRYRGIFATSIVASLLPHSAAQLYATFGTQTLYDAGFNLASYYKLFGYLIPVIGLVFDYRRASQADAELATTARQLDIARDIQTSLLPREKPDVAGVDVAGYSIASEAVGGDYFDYIKLPDGSMMVVIADVSGHDLGAALLMANARAYLKAWAEDESDLSIIVENLNEFVANDAQGRRFITGMLVRIPSTGLIDFVCAGHTGYLINPAGEMTTLEQRNVPLGVFDELKTDSAKIDLCDGDTLLLLTDGVAELPDSKGVQFGIERLAAVVASCRNKTADETVAAIRQAANKWAGSVEPFDDMTAVIVKRSCQS